MDEFSRLLSDVAGGVGHYRARRSTPRSSGRSTRSFSPPAFGGPLPEGPSRAGRRDRSAGRGRRARAGRHRRPAVLRLRHRRRTAGGDGRRRAGRRLGPGGVQRACSSPAAASAEEVGRRLAQGAARHPGAASVGFVTGAQAANTVGPGRRAASRARRRPDGTSSADGLIGAPRVRVVGGAERHATIDRSLRLLGFGDGSVEPVARRRQRRDRRRRSARGCCRRAGGPTIVCLQAGNVNTGACDDLRPAMRRWCTSTAAGCTSTAPSGSGRRPVPATRHLVDGDRAGRLVGMRRATSG